ncbi:hypothetical protein [Streptomyces sp. NPDC102360]
MRWGGDWQTALWALYAALAGWLTWDALDATARGRVPTMLAWESDRLTG